MYIRYKSRKRDRKVFKILFLACAIFSAAYGVYHFRSVLFFWKYSISQLERDVMNVESVGDIALRRKMLLGLQKACDEYKTDNLLSAEAYINAGRVRYLLGEAHMPGNFNRLIILDRVHDADAEASAHFITCIKDFKKAMALSGPDVQPEYTIMLAKASYITRYYSPSDIAEMLSVISNPGKLKDADDRRFYAMIQVLNNNEKTGFEILNGLEGVNRKGDDALFLAVIYRNAKKYTNAIMEYRKVLETTADIDTKLLVHYNLGRIYYTQGLFLEALREFSEAALSEKPQVEHRLWQGKSYAALGDLARARESWLEGLKIDKENAELKSLLLAK